VKVFHYLIPAEKIGTIKHMEKATVGPLLLILYDMTGF
jgi:hypothetical protein